MNFPIILLKNNRSITEIKRKALGNKRYRKSYVFKFKRKYILDHNTAGKVPEGMRLKYLY